MEIATPFAVKFAVIALLSAFLLPAVGVATIGQAVVAAALVTVLGFLVGDRWALHRFGNTAALIIDFALAVAIFRLAPDFMPGMSVSFGGALAVGGVVTLAEVLFHVYLERLEQQR